MKITEKQTVSKEIEVVVDVLCNMCKGSLDYWKADELKAGIEPHNRAPIEAGKNKKLSSSFYGLVEANVGGGYNSKELSDMTRYTFSMCEKCLVKLFNSFAIPPDVRDYHGDGPTTWEEDRKSKAWAEDYNNKRNAEYHLYHLLNKSDEPLSFAQIEPLFLKTIEKELKFEEMIAYSKATFNLDQYVIDMFAHARERATQQADNTKPKTESGRENPHGAVWANIEKTKLRAPTDEELSERDIISSVFYSRGDGDGVSLNELLNSGQYCIHVAENQSKEECIKDTAQKLLEQNVLMIENDLLLCNPKSPRIQSFIDDLSEDTVRYLKYKEFNVLK